MQYPLIPRRTLVWLAAVAFFLPVAVCVVVGVSTLLTHMGDATGGIFLARVALAGGILWVIDLISLVLVLAIRTLDDTADASNDREPADLEQP